MSSPTLTKMTPVVIVDAIEPLLPFYVDGLGFTKVAAVAYEGTLGFVMLIKDSLELMFQSTASVRADSKDPSVQPGRVCLYFDVTSLDEAINAVPGAPIAVPRRATPYGMDEIYVRDPAGNTVGFAQSTAKGD
ncbi:MAG: hypothetical protein JSR77_08530 [Planctomycetes bacterium]|nr:hypothetical protein [Planctomycetota bacterium]